MTVDRPTALTITAMCSPITASILLITALVVKSIPQAYDVICSDCAGSSDWELPIAAIGALAYFVVGKVIQQENHAHTYICIHMYGRHRIISLV